MKKLIINKVKYHLPESYSETKLGVYQRLKNLPLDLDLETDYKINYLTVLSGVDSDILSSLDKSDFDKLWSLTGWLSEPPVASDNFKQLFNVGNKKYYFFTDFQENTDFQPFIDAFKILGSAPTFWHVAPGVLATFIRPVVRIEYDYSLEKMRTLKGRKRYNKANYIKRVVLEEYDSSKIEIWAKDLEEISVQDVATVFFYLNSFLTGLLTSTLQTYSNDESLEPLERAKIKELLRLQNRIIQNSLDGMKF